jgi:uncharacterized protein YciI
MYAIALIRYRKSLDDVVKATDGHRAYLKTLKDAGTLVASGPFEPRYGGAVILRVPDEDWAARLDAIRDGDPFVKGGIAQWELLGWSPVIGKEGLDGIK